MSEEALSYFEDAVIGRRNEVGTHTITAEEIVRFAGEFDPQPFHVDPEAAARSPYGGLIASGWHTCALAMRAICDGFLRNAASFGSPGVDEIRWRRPVRPGDTLTCFSTVLEARPSRSKPDRGIVVSQTEMVNQRGETVMTMRGMSLMRRRPEPDRIGN
jgi:acyl dehydratase